MHRLVLGNEVVILIRTNMMFLVSPIGGVLGAGDLTIDNVSLVDVGRLVTVPDASPCDTAAGSCGGPVCVLCRRWGCLEVTI